MFGMNKYYVIHDKITIGIWTNSDFIINWDTKKYRGLGLATWEFNKL